MSVALLSSLSLVDPQYALNVHHRLNVGRTAWILALPTISGTNNHLWNIGGLWQGWLLDLGAGAGGWKFDARRGGGQSVFLDNTTSDSINANIAVSSFLSATSGTMAVWTRPTASPVSAGNSYLLPSLLSDGFNGSWGIHIGTISGVTAIWAYLYDGAEKRVSGAYTQNQWVRAMWVHTGGTLFFYLNGVSQGSTAAGNQQALSVFPSISGSTAPYGGSVDDISIWNRGLSASEAWEDYAESIAGYPMVLNRMSPQLSYKPALAVTKFRRTLSDRVGSRGSQ